MSQLSNCAVVSLQVRGLALPLNQHTGNEVLLPLREMQELAAKTQVLHIGHRLVHTCLLVYLVRGWEEVRLKGAEGRENMSSCGELGSGWGLTRR